MPERNVPEILARMSAAKGWERLGDMLVRSWQFPTTRHALEFVEPVVELAERLDHHPTSS